MAFTLTVDLEDQLKGCADVFLCGTKACRRSPDDLLLRSLNLVTKDTPIMTMILGRPTPDPRLGSSVELSGRDAYGLLNLVGSGKALSSQSIAAQEAPPALLQIQPCLAPVGIKT